MEHDPNEPRTKSEMCEIKGWPKSFFDNLKLPKYPIGKRDYYKLADIEPTLEKIKQVPSWESTKLKAHRTTTSHSPLKGYGTEEARERIKRRMRKPSTGMNADASY